MGPGIGSAHLATVEGEGDYDGRVRRFAGRTRYLLQDHLGNVRMEVSDQKDLVQGSQQSLVARILSQRDYYPFGMQHEGSTGARFGYNGKPLDTRLGGVSGEGSYDYGFRVYDAGLARFFSVDPLREKYPELTPYQFASNTPIQAIDLDGLEAVAVVGGADLWSEGLSTTSVGITRDVQVFAESQGINKANIKSFNTEITGDKITIQKERLKSFIKSQYQSGNPIAIYAYSLGGPVVLNALSELKIENPKIKIDLLVTVDPAMGSLSQPYIIPSNVSSNINIYQSEESSIGSRGYPTYAEDASKTSIINDDRSGKILGEKGKAHGNIDENQRSRVVKLLNNFLKTKKKSK